MTRILRRQPDRGFTLVEVLVVLLILAITAGAAVFALGPSKKDPVRETAEKLQQALSTIAEEALLRSTSFGLIPTPCGWSFVQYAADEKTGKPHWKPFAGRGLSHCLPREMAPLAVRVEGITRQPAAAPSEDREEEDKTAGNGPEPLLIVPAGGDFPAFVIQLALRAQAPSWQIRGLSNGTLRMEPLHETE